MERQLKDDKFSATIKAQKVTLEGLSFNPGGESKKVRSLLGLTGSMASLSALPPELNHSPFTVQFGADGTHSLKRNDGGPGQIDFTFEDIDSLILFVDKCIAVSQDILRAAPVPRGGSVPNYGDTFEGRG